MTTKIWAVESIGATAFATKAQALKHVPDCAPVRCDFGLGGVGWIAMSRYSTENNGAITTPDGRVIEGVVQGWCENGCLIGLRGLAPTPKFVNAWREIMDRVIQAGLELHNYRRSNA